MGWLWTFAGFNRAALEIISDNAESAKLPGVPDREEYSRREVWYDQEIALYIYRFADGRVLEGYIQAEPWCGDPITFLALRDHKTKEPVQETLWADKELNRCC